MKKLLIAVVAFLALALVASTGFAQPVAAPRAAAGQAGGGQMGGQMAGGDNALRAGVSSLSFGIPGGGNPYAGGTFGYWYMMNQNMNIGFNVGLSIDREEMLNPSEGEEETVTSWDFLLAPTMRYYTSTRGTVAPFYFGQARFRINDDGLDEDDFGDNEDDEDPQFGIAGGIGVEWFPVTNFSISGQAGIAVDLLRQAPKEPIALSTFTSSLAANIYF